MTTFNAACRMTERRHEWDPNLDIIECAKEISGSSFVNHYRSKKNGMVSARD